MGRFIIKLLLSINILACLGLAASYFAPVTNPEELWFLAVLGLGAPYLLIVNLVFVFIWIVFRRWYFILSLLLLILGWGNFTKIIGTNITSKEVEGEKQLKVMSYNVQNFDLYNWTENEESRDRMLELIKDQDPDIIAFQEFYTEEDDDHFHNIRLLVNELDFKYFHFEKTLTLEYKNHWGLATFSKYPLENKNRVPIEGSRGNLITYCDVKLPENGKTQYARVFNVHLQSIGFGRNDYKFFKKFQIQNPDIESSKSVLRKLKNAYIKRGQQADLLKDLTDQSPIPVIVCGDFNDTPISYTYQKIKGDLKDAFLESGFGLGGTYAGPLPSFRIDYILVDTLFQPNNFEVIEKDYSDHFPVSVVLNYD